MEKLKLETSNKGGWNITLAKYNIKRDQVAERRVNSNLSYNKALKFLNDNTTKPLYMWHNNAADMEPMSLGAVETLAYHYEYKKVIN